MIAPFVPFPPSINQNKKSLPFSCLKWKKKLYQINYKILFKTFFFKSCYISISFISLRFLSLCLDNNSDFFLNPKKITSTFASHLRIEICISIMYGCPPLIAEKTKKEKESFSRLISSLKDLYRSESIWWFRFRLLYS